MGKQTITDNYFRDKSLNGEGGEDEYAPVIVNSIYEKNNAASK